MMRRSTVTTAGRRTRFSSTPASTSREPSPPLPSSVSRRPASKADSSKALICQLAPERSIFPPAIFSFCSGLGTRLQVTRIFIGARLSHREPQRFFQTEQNLVVDVDQVHCRWLGLPMSAQLVDDRARGIRWV